MTLPPDKEPTTGQSLIPVRSGLMNQSSEFPYIGSLCLVTPLKKTSFSPPQRWVIAFMSSREGCHLMLPLYPPW